MRYWVDPEIDASQVRMGHTKGDLLRWNGVRVTRRQYKTLRKTARKQRGRKYLS